MSPSLSVDTVIQFPVCVLGELGRWGESHFNCSRQNDAFPSMSYSPEAENIFELVRGALKI